MDEDIEQLYDHVEDPSSDPKPIDEEEGEVPDEETGQVWLWTWTNMGAVLTMAGLLIVVFMFSQAMTQGSVFLLGVFLAILLVLVGYGLIVMDHISKRRKGARGPDRFPSGDTEQE